MQEPVNFAFLHGGGQGGWVWDQTIAALDGQTNGAFGRALALDVPGCGTKRGRLTDNLDNADVARELIADIERAGMNDVILVGHSQAGQVMPFMAGMRPTLVRRLIYVTCSIPLAGQSVLQMMGDGRQGISENEVGFPFDPKTETILEKYPLMFCNDMSPEQTASFVGKLGQDSWPPKTYTFRKWPYDYFGIVPASYVICLRDNILPTGWQRRFADRFKAERQICIDAGHQVMNTRPNTLAEALLIEATTA